MLKTVSDLFTEVLVRNNRTTTDGFITDAMLKAWLQDSHVWAAAQFKWPFTEGRLSTTFTTGSGSGGDEWYFEGYKADSIRRIVVGGKRLTKLTHDDYNILMEERPGNDERVYSDFNRAVFINPNADIGGTLVAYGQYLPNIDPSLSTDITIFSNYDEEGNEAIVEKMTSYIKRREHLFSEAESHDQRAAVKLAEVWKRILDEQFVSQTTPERDGMFKRINVVSGGMFDDLNTDQF
jgi:hypothetical protein